MLNVEVSIFLAFFASKMSFAADIELSEFRKASSLKLNEVVYNLHGPFKENLRTVMFFFFSQGLTAPKHLFNATSARFWSVGICLTVLSR